MRTCEHFKPLGPLKKRELAMNPRQGCGSPRTRPAPGLANTSARPLDALPSARLTMNSFLDRREAGRTLAARLGEYAGRPDVTVLALPRGGVPVAYEIARALSVPLDVILVRKIYHPGRHDVPVATIASGDFQMLDPDVIAARGIDRRDVEREIAQARHELVDQERGYRGTRPTTDVAGRTIILVYDG